MSEDNRRLMQALAQYPLPVLLDSAGEVGRYIPSLKAVTPGMRLAGPAYTVAGTAGDNLAVQRGLYHCLPGVVLAVTVGGEVGTAHFGGLMAVAAKTKGLLGLVIDGAVRDASEIAALPFPVFAAGVSARKSRKEYRGELQVPIRCAGVKIHPGDSLFGDEHGVLVLSPVDAPGVLEKAQKLEVREAEIVRRLQQGEALADITGLDVQ